MDTTYLSHEGRWSAVVTQELSKLYCFPEGGTQGGQREKEAEEDESEGYSSTLGHAGQRGCSPRLLLSRPPPTVRQRPACFCTTFLMRHRSAAGEPLDAASSTGHGSFALLAARTPRLAVTECTADSLARRMTLSHACRPALFISWRLSIHLCTQSFHHVPLLLSAIIITSKSRGEVFW